MILFSPYIKAKKVNVTAFLVWFLFCLFLTFSGPSAVDWSNYTGVSIDWKKFYFYREPTGWILPFLFGSFENGNLYSAFVISFILTFATLKSIDVDSERRVINFLLAMMLLYSNFYILLSVNGLRQGLALGFLLFSYASIRSEKIPIAIGFFLLACLSHNSAILFAAFIFAGYVYKSVCVIFGMALFWAAEIINMLAGKNQLPPVNDNSMAYLLIIVLLVVAYGFTRLATGARFGNLDGYVIILFGISISFFNLPNVFERMVYYTIPLLIVVTGSAIFSFRPGWIASYFLLFIVFSSIVYNLTHESVTSNFTRL